MGLSGVFDEVYGCSAGAVNACYFLSGQGAYGTTIYYQNINNRKFIHPLRLWKIVDLDFLFDHSWRMKSRCWFPTCFTARRNFTSR